MTRGAFNENRQLLAVLAIALVCRIVWWFIGTAVIENEGAEYARLADNLRNGVGYVGILGAKQALFPPLYPMLIALGSLIVGDAEVAGRLVSLASGILLVFAMHRVTHELFGRSAALIAATLCALYPLLIAFSVTVYSESLSLALVCLGLYATIVLLREPSWGRSIATGSLFGAAYLVRPEGIVFAFIAAALLAIAAIMYRRSIAACAGHVAAVLLAMAVLAAPYVAFLSVESAALRLEGKTHFNAIVNNRMRSGMSYAEAARGLGPNLELDGPHLMADQFELLKHSQVGTLDMLYPIAAAPVARVRSLAYDVVTNQPLGLPLAGLLAAVGFLLSRWWKRSLLPGLALLAFFGLQLLSLLLLEFRFERYLFPTLPLFLPWAAAGIERLGHAFMLLTQRLTSSDRVIRGASAAAYAALIAAVLIIAFPATLEVGEFSQSRESYLKQAGEWIDADFGHGQPEVATYGTVIPYYAKGTLRYLPFAPEPLALRYLHVVGPDYVVVRSGDERQAPYMQDWLSRGIPDRCAVPATTVRGDDGSIVRIWSWKCSDSKSPKT
jgi:4-amino-4-deoxy-L-arabinose transferase-like glycosyltransferase